MSGPVGSSTWFGTPGYDLEQSLRFDDASLSSLTRTPAAAGNTKKWTFSCWYKRGVHDGESHTLFSTDISEAGADDFDYIRVQTDDSVYVAVRNADSEYVLRLITNNKLRDSSAWYHIVVRFDSTAGTPGQPENALYINGVLQDDLAAGVTPDQNAVTRFNSNVPHHIGQWNANAAFFLDGHLAEVNFVDGYSLPADYFGTTGEYGEWKPIQYGGAYGTNGFHLPFKNDYTVQGFSTVISRGNATAKYIGGVGFQPDMVWNATRTTQQNKVIYDSVRGVTNELRTNSDTNQRTADGVTAFKADGFLRGSSNECNENNITYVDWCWDMGGSNANNTTGGIDSVVRANTGYGQSIVTYTGTGSAASVGHGLGIAPKCIFVKNYNTDSRDWATLHMSQYGGGEGHKAIMRLNSDAAYSRTNQAQYWNSTAPTTSVFTVGTHNTTNEDGKLYVAYCWGDVAGYSKFHHYFGNGQATGNTTNVGFRPAWLMIKKTTTTEDWIVYDSVRDEGSTFGKFMELNTSTGELEADQDGVPNIAETVATFTITDTGFTPSTDDGRTNSNGGTYMYMAFADTRDFAFFLDQSGNNNDWEPNNLTESDISLDNPTNNFCTLNPVDSNAGNNIVLSEGNLRFTNSGSNWDNIAGTFGFKTGKWYWEMMPVSGSMDEIFTGIKDTSAITVGTNAWVSGTILWYNHVGGELRVNGTNTTADYGDLAIGDILGVAVNMDDRQITFYKNNSAMVTNYAIPSEILEAMPYALTDAATLTAYNFGQDSSFAGAKEAQGNTDGNGEGDFAYAPPSNFLALCANNLPEPAVFPARHFKALKYTGNATDDRSIVVGFKPDFSWIKSRNTTNDHLLFDSVKGVGKYIRSNVNEGDISNANTLQAFETDGFQIGTDGRLNTNNDPVISWNWAASEAFSNDASSTSVGSIDSAGKVGTAAGISIIGWVGTGSAGTIAHGLSKAPEQIWVKNRSKNSQFAVYYGDNTDYLALTDNDATADYANYWNDTSPTSTVFSVGSDGDVSGASNENVIAYCFHSVDGFSDMGIYGGNNNADGTFVYTGFRPAFVMNKAISRSGNWMMTDSARSPTNVNGVGIFANADAAEYSDANTNIDLLSNGFKWRTDDDNNNDVSETYLYIAFAESPFKHTNAR